jgi:hypothetical protein
MRKHTIISLLTLVLSVCPWTPEGNANEPADLADLRDHVYPQALASMEMLVRNGRRHQENGRAYQALRLYFKALGELGQLNSDNPYIQKAAQDLGRDIYIYIAQLKDYVQEKGLIPYRGKMYTFDGLQKVLKKEEERRLRYERYLQWEREQRRMRSENYRQQEERRRWEEQRLREDYRFQQEQRRQNEERRRNYEMRN